MKRPRTAYELKPEPTALSAGERRQAITWWQEGHGYQILQCPVCQNRLEPQPADIALQCPTAWCSYVTDEIPWAVYVAWKQQS